MKKTAFAFALITSAAHANGYADHEAVQMYAAQPCGDVIAVIQGSDVLDALGDPQAAMNAASVQGMIWGFLLGYDASAGGLHTDAQTTLERLEAQCAANPDMTAKAILDGL